MKEIYERYGPALVRKAERMLRRRDDALDIVHGLFVDLLASNAAPPELPYLYRATTNRCLNFLRDKKNRARLLDAAALPSHAVSDEARALSMDALLRFVPSLDEKRAEVFAFHFLDELTQEEIEALTGTSRRTIGKYIQDIRDQMGALWEAS